MKEKSKQLIKSKIAWIYEKGVFHILGTSVINKVLSFLTNIFIVRFLTKADYGVFGYANNIISFFILVSGLGMLSGILQYGSEQGDEPTKNSFFRYGMRFGAIINGVLGILIVLYVIFIPITIKEAGIYILQLCLLPIFDYAYNYFCIILRCKKENKKYSLLLNINTTTYLVFSCLGAFLFGITGVIMGRYCSYLISIVMGYRQCGYAKIRAYTTRALQKKQKQEIIKYSSVCCASNALSQVLYLLDVYLIAEFVRNVEVVASYKVATLIPTALDFIPLGIITFVYPYFAENNKDYNWIKSHTKQLFCIMGGINCILSLVLFFGAPLIIELLWGADYMDALVPFRILSINYFITGTFRILSGNILAMLKKVKVNLYVSLFAGVSNIILDIVLIKRYGSNGAAIATMGVVIISSLISGVALIYNINKLKEK
ncbi:MAG: oligosaccharide flippase family protein [Lachnospiraceae bacterium]